LRGPNLTHLVASDSIRDADDEDIEPLIRYGDAIVLWYQKDLPRVASNANEI
jgi:hypothetical protein